MSVAIAAGRHRGEVQTRLGVLETWVLVSRRLQTRFYKSWSWSWDLRQWRLGLHHSWSVKLRQDRNHRLNYNANTVIYRSIWTLPELRNRNAWEVPVGTVRYCAALLCRTWLPPYRPDIRVVGHSLKWLNQRILARRISGILYMLWQLFLTVITSLCG